MRRGDLLVGGDILQFGQFLHRRFDDRRPVIELVVVGVGQRVLVLRLGEAAADADVLPRLHEEFGALDRRYLGAQALNDLVRGDAALVMRLQLDEEAGGIFGRVVGRGAGEIQHAGNRRILTNGFGKLVHDPLHVGVGDVLARLRLAEDEAGILLREKALWDLHVEQAGRGHQDQGRDQHAELVPEDEFEAPVIAAERRLKAALGDAVEPARRTLAVTLQEQRAHHRRQGQGDHRGGDYRHRDRDRELAEQPADDPAHEQERDEHRDQREGDRDDRKADLAGALQRRLERRVALFEIAHDVLDHDDCIVDHKADRHQRDVVEAVADAIHDGKGREQ